MSRRTRRRTNRRVVAARSGRPVCATAIPTAGSSIEFATAVAVSESESTASGKWGMPGQVCGRTLDSESAPDRKPPAETGNGDWEGTSAGQLRPWATVFKLARAAGAHSVACYRVRRTLLTVATFVTVRSDHDGDVRSATGIMMPGGPGPCKGCQWSWPGATGSPGHSVSSLRLLRVRVSVPVPARPGRWQ
jgi:hypothetical protein